MLLGGRFGHFLPAEVKVFLFYKMLRPGMGPTEPHIAWLPLLLFSQGQRGKGAASNHLPQSGTYVPSAVLWHA